MPFVDMRWTVVSLAALAAMSGTATSAPARSTDVTVERRGALESQVLRELNRVRAARGLSRLRPQPGLRTAATGHTRTMLAAGFFAHESPDGTPFHERLRRHYPAQGWRRWTVGENILSGGSSLDARAIVAAWLTSPPHRDIVLSNDFREVGIGAFVRPDAPGSFGGSETLAVTADFGLRAKS